MQSDSMHPEVVVPWIPRLQYRAKLGNDPEPVVNVDAISPVSSAFSSSLASTAPSTPALSERSPSPNSSLSAYRKYRQKLMESSSSSNHLSHNNDNAAERKPPQKRASSFFNFFSVKEPSQQALEDYQRQLRRSGGASSKDRRLDTVGLTGISSAKLPPTVPKVNSKWDGVPHQLIKEKQKEKEKQKQKQKRNAHLQFSGYSRSLRSSGSERSGSTTTSSSALSRSSSQHQEPSYSLAAGRLQSHTSASNFSDLYGWESGIGSIISISAGGTGGDDGNSPEGGKRIKYRSKQKLPRKNASYLQAPPPPLSQIIPDQYLDQDLSDLGSLLGPPTAQSSSPHPEFDNPGNFSGKWTKSGSHRGVFFRSFWSVSNTSQTYIPRVLEVWRWLGERAGVRFWFIVEIFLLSPPRMGCWRCRIWESRVKENCYDIYQADLTLYPPSLSAGRMGRDTKGGRKGGKEMNLILYIYIYFLARFIKYIPTPKFQFLDEMACHSQFFSPTMSNKISFLNKGGGG